MGKGGGGPNAPLALSVQPAASVWRLVAVDRFSELLLFIQRNLRGRKKQGTPLRWWEIMALQGWSVVRRRLCEGLNWGS